MDGKEGVFVTEIINKASTLKKRKALRKIQTPEEQILWSKLRNNQFGIKFRRQVSIGSYIVDFYCPQKRLAIEVDGSQHYTEDGQKYDAVRTSFLNSFNINVIRFSNSDIKENIDGALETETAIAKIIEQDQPPAVKKINFCKNCAYQEFCFS